MILQTARTVLRPFKKSDVKDVFEYCSDESVGKPAGWPPHKSITDSEKVLGEIFINHDSMFAIVYEGKVVGSVGLLPDPSRQNDSCLMLGYALGRKYWNLGLMTECCRAIISYAFNSLNMSVISAHCYSDNISSRKVLIKCGFVFEGVLHFAEQTYDGDVKDKDCFYLTKNQYFASSK